MTHSSLLWVQTKHPVQGYTSILRDPHRRWKRSYIFVWKTPPPPTLLHNNAISPSVPSRDPLLTHFGPPRTAWVPPPCCSAPNPLLHHRYSDKTDICKLNGLFSIHLIFLVLHDLVVFFFCDPDRLHRKPFAELDHEDMKCVESGKSSLIKEKSFLVGVQDSDEHCRCSNALWHREDCRYKTIRSSNITQWHCIRQVHQVKYEYYDIKRYTDTF